MGRRILKGELDELRSLGIHVNNSDKNGDTRFAELIDIVKQLMLLQFRIAYGAKETEKEIAASAKV